MKKLFAFGCAILILSGCAEDTCGPCKYDSFEVTVITYPDVPVGAAWIEGGGDWDCFTVKTDSRGVAVLPGRALGQRALIHRNDYFPRVVHLEPTKYYLSPTPRRLEYVGKVSDRSIRFSSEMLLTLEYNGKYRAYSYSDTSVTELVKTLLPVTAIRTTRFYGDTLWFSTHDDGIFVYSVENPLDPVHLFFLDIPGYLDAFAVRDSIIAVSDPFGYEPVRVFSYTPGGEIRKVAEVDAYNVRQMEFMSHYLAILSYDAYNLPAAEFIVADLGQPAEPEIVYALEEHGGRSGLIHDDVVLIGPYGSTSDMRVSYTTIDLHDPGHPVYIGRTYSDSWLSEVSDGSHAVGSYCIQNQRCEPWSSATSVLERTSEGYWQTAAIVTDVGYTRHSVHAPPYFVIGADLWRLSSR